MEKRGMSLNELLIAVVILSVVAALAVPSYLKTIEKTRGEEALAVLRLLRAAERVYYQDWNERYTTFITLANEGYLQNPKAETTRSFNYTMTINNAAPPRSVTVTATRKSGCNVNETITLTQGGAQAGNWSPKCP